MRPDRPSKRMPISCLRYGQTRKRTGDLGMQRSIFIRFSNGIATFACVACVISLTLALAGCGNETIQQPTTDSSHITEDMDSDSLESHVETVDPQSDKSDKESEEDMEAIKMSIDDIELDVKWEDNESVDALKSLLTPGDMTIHMSMYGGFEQVGALGSSLPRNDVQTTTTAGDIVLYSGNQIVIFYGSNSWAYTRLGTIQNKTEEELEELLGNDDVTLTLALN